MSEINSQFFNGKTYSATDFVESNKNTMKDGILPNTDFFKVLPASNMAIGVTSGRGWVQGHAFSSDSTLAFTLDRADGVLDRVDTVIIRLDLTTDNEKIECKVIKGTIGGGATAPVHDGTYYDLVIAQIAVAHGTTAITTAMITDKRGDGNLCGWSGAISSEQLTFDEKADKMTVNMIAAAGDIQLTAASTAPSGWIICNGQAISRTLYPKLFAAISTIYGGGNGTTTFNVPDLSGRVVIGCGGTYSFRSTGGSPTQSLSVNQMPQHSHSYTDDDTRLNSAPYYDAMMITNCAGCETYWKQNTTTTNKVTGTTGTGSSFSIVQPYIALNYIIFGGA